MIQAIAVGGNIDAVNHYALDNLLWEATIFWHWDGSCYSDPQWQGEWTACITNGNRESCAIKETGTPPVCPIDALTSTIDSNGCTVTTVYPTTRNWALDFNQDLCAEGTVGEATELELRFDREFTNEGFTLTFNYNSGSSETITFDGTTIFATPTGDPLQVDMTDFDQDREETIQRGCR